jgi:DNA polymerase IV (DinB-like DNA polymerase)
MIIHIDFDYFFAQCEEIRRPEIKDKAVVVCVYSGRSKESGVVSTCNYIARKYGVKSSIPIKIAKARLAQVSQSVFLPSDIKYYSEKSNNIMTLIRNFVDKYSLYDTSSTFYNGIKPVNFEYIGLDECFIEATNIANFDFTKAKELAYNLKKIIKETGLTCSIGIGPNKLIAKVASDFQKPDGMTMVKPNESKNFISNCNVDKIPGVGTKMTAKLFEMGIHTCGQLSEFGLFRLIDSFGKRYGTFLYKSAQGIDNEPVKSRPSAKQIGRIVTLKKDISHASEMDDEIHYICKAVYKTALDKNMSFRNIGVLLILNDLYIISRSRSLKTHTRDFNELYSSVKSILNQTINNDRDIKVRRLGIKLSDLKYNEGQNTMLKYINNHFDKEQNKSG